VWLNVVYRLKETRAWWKQKLTIIGLTLALAALIIVALGLVLYGGKIGQLMTTQIGLSDVFRIAWKVLQCRFVRGHVLVVLDHLLLRSPP
jgi:membrane protein